MREEDGGERRCVSLIDGGRAYIEKQESHAPHEWKWWPDWGPQVLTVYHCPGVK